MKKIALVLAVLLFTAPAFAALSITCSNSGPVVKVKYNAGGGTLPRAFALDITLSGGVTMDNAIVAPCPDFYIFPGSINITTGAVTGWGSAVAGGGNGQSNMTIEMASLHSTRDPSHPNPPADSADLFSFYAMWRTVVTITENPARGGVAMEDGSANGLGIPVCSCKVCPEDVDGNGFVNVNDRGAVTSWLSANTSWPFYSAYCPAPCPQDVDGNGFVNVNDRGAVTAWLSAYTTWPMYSAPCP